MTEINGLFEKIDELLGDAGMESEIGCVTLIETVEITTVSQPDDDRFGIKAAKIGHFASALFPHLLPKVA